MEGFPFWKFSEKHRVLSSGLQFINPGLFLKEEEEKKRRGSDLQKEHGNITMDYFPLFKV